MDHAYTAAESGSFPVASVAPTSPHEEDAELVRALIADEPSAWREFNSRYSRLVMSCISRITARFGYASPDDVREIYATLCLQLLSNDKHKLRSFQPDRGTRLGTWLGLLASHTAYDFLRSIRRTPKHDELSNASDVSADELDPSDRASLKQQAALLTRALAELGERDRTFVQLFYGEGLSPEEVATRMGINVKTVYTKKHKLQGRLASLLGRLDIAA